MRLPLILCALLSASPALAAQPTQDWPCIQPRQPQLSLGQMWTGPAPDAASAALAGDPAVGALAEALALRRVSEAEAGALIDAFVAEGGAAPARLTAVMTRLLDRVNTERAAILDGIGRYGRGQGGLAAQIEARRARMAALQAAPAPDYDAIDAEERALDWDLRIFEERRQMLTAVCDSPVLLEKRLFGIARLLAARLPVTPTPAP